MLIFRGISAFISYVPLLPQYDSLLECRTKYLQYRTCHLPLSQNVYQWNHFHVKNKWVVSFGVLYYCSVKRTSLHIYIQQAHAFIMTNSCRKKQLYPIFARHIRDAMQATILQKLKTTCHEVFRGDTARRNSKFWASWLDSIPRCA